MCAGNAYSQKLLWGVDLQAYIDNREYKSEYQISQSILGVNAIPEIGVGFDKHHAIMGGVSVGINFGSCNFVDRITPTLYYNFDYKPFKFKAGIFNKDVVYDSMPRALMYDSLHYFRPTMAGIFWQFEKKWGKINVWLDWIGCLTRTTREDFTFGSSAHFTPLPTLYGGWNGYLHHSTGNKKIDSPDYRPLTEYTAYLVYVGANLAPLTPLDKLYVDAGFMGSYTRVRGRDPQQYSSNGLQIRAGIEWQGIGVENTYYTGGDMMPLWDTYGSELFLGDPFYKNCAYNRTDIYINFINTSKVKVCFDLAMHFAQNKLSWGQMLKVSVNINSSNAKKKDPKSGYIWHKWFRKN